MDQYTKIVLTVIATALVIIAAGELVKPALAQLDSMCTYSTPCYVEIKTCGASYTQPCYMSINR